MDTVYVEVTVATVLSKMMSNCWKFVVAATTPRARRPGRDLARETLEGPLPSTSLPSRAYYHLVS